MIAYVLQMILAAFSLFSVTIMITMGNKNITASKKQWTMLFLPILLLFMTIAFRFEWSQNANNDLSRYFIDFEGVKYNGSSYELRHADEYSSVWRLIVTIFCQLNDYHWFPVITVGVDFVIFMYILINAATDYKFSAGEVLLCLMLRLSLMPLIMSISASRNVLAYTFFSLGVYIYFRNGFRDLRMYFWMIIGVLTHAAVFLGVVVFVVSLLAKRHKAAVLIIPVLVMLLNVLIVPALLESDIPLLHYFGEQWGHYLEDRNNYDKVKRLQILAGLIPLSLGVFAWHFGRNKSFLKARSAFVISSIITALCFAPINATMFLRMCYPVAVLIPIFWAAMKNTEWRKNSDSILLQLVTTGSTILIFATTLGGWLFEIYWFFKM